MMQLFLLNVTQEEHKAMHRGIDKDVKKIAQAAGVEMNKTAHICMQRGVKEPQRQGIEELNKLLGEIKTAEDIKHIFIQTGIATGYANAMYHFGLITQKELSEVIEVINQVSEKTADHLKNVQYSSYIGFIKKIHLIESRKIGKGEGEIWRKRAKQQNAGFAVKASS